MYTTSVLLALVTASSWTTSALAVPLTAPLWPRQNPGSGPDDGTNENSSSGLSSSVWIPLAVIAGLFVLGTIAACFGRRIRHGVRNAAETRLNTNAGTTPREVTADQLAGTNAAGATGGTNRARRPRRTRRTPSQISTHSLPAYMKEPGEQEIVIVRGADELEDDIPITVTMPPVDEHSGVNTPRGSYDLTRPPSMYSPIPHTPHDLPLLHGNDLDSQQLLNVDRPALTTRASFDSTISSTESGPENYLDEAPPYDTVILDDVPANQTAAAPAAPASAHARTSTEQSGAGSTRRRSVFSSIFNPRTSRGAPPPPPPIPPTAASPEPRSSSGHTRESSGPSVRSVPASERDARRSRMIRHQPSHSGSGSMFSLLSRTRSNGTLGAEALTSPSLISLHSISSPLTHTLVKSEFTYPKNGPTPEQIKLISSRENLMRFGKPYGADAIAFAASTSRAELEPPPGFEDVAGPSGAQEGRDTPSSGSHDEDGHDDAQPTASPSSSDPEHIVAELQEVESPDVVSPGVSLPSPTVPSSSDVASGPTVPEPQSVVASIPEPPSAIASQVSSSSTSSSEPISPPGLSPSPEPVQSQSLRGRSPLLPAVAPSPTVNAPPSAFKAIPTATPTSGSFPARAASRASSFMSYATAEESLHSPTPYESQMDLNDHDDAYESAAETPSGTAPPTPRISPRHAHEESDMTITPQR